MDGYPDDWPTCPGCGEPVLDGHITCGSAECDEQDARETRCPTLFEFRRATLNEDLVTGEDSIGAESAEDTKSSEGKDER